MDEDPGLAATELGEDPEVVGVTRRDLLAGAGVAAAGALVIGSGAEASVGAVGVGAGPTDRRTVWFVGQLDQNGPSVHAYGYLTRIAGLGAGDLYTKPPARTANDPRSADSTAARFTFAIDAQMTGMSVVGEVLSAVATGIVRVYLLPNGGARFSEPASFAAGNPIAEFTGIFQNALSVDSPNRASFEMNADLQQTSVRAFTIGGKSRQLGRAKLPWNMNASGRGERTEPTTPRAILRFSGNIGVIDARQHA